MREAHRDNTKSDGSADWVCFNCTNLNYSFRKVCNRCRAITREENQHSYLQMQYMHAYYHHPFPQEHRSPLRHSANAPSYSHHTLNNEEPGTACAKEPQQQIFLSIKNQEGINESGFMFLLQNAWEGLYASEEVSQFKPEEEGENTREEEEQDYENEDILSNFDLTFI